MSAPAPESAPSAEVPPKEHYQPISTSLPILVERVIRYLVDRARKGSKDADFSPGTRLSSGYVAGGTIAGLVSALVAGLGKEAAVDFGKALGVIATSDLSGVIWFSAIGIVLHVIATRAKGALDGGPPAAAPSQEEA